MDNMETNDIDTHLKLSKKFPKFNVVQKFKCPKCRHEHIMPKDNLDWAVAYDALQEKFFAYIGAVNTMIREATKDAGSMMNLTLRELLNQHWKEWRDKNEL